MTERTEEQSSKKIGLIAGSGQFPLIFSKKAKTGGYAVYTVAYIGEADQRVEADAEAVVWLHLGQIKRLIKFFKSNGVGQAVMMGAIKKTGMFKNVRPDLKALSIIAGIRSTHDDGVLRAFAAELEKEGIVVRSATFLLPGLLADKGCWSRRRPDRSEQADIALGLRIAREIGRMDIGQCIVVGGGSVLAVEAIDGTDATIRRGGNLGNGEAVVVKVCKPNQDIRFDVPAVGVQTIETMADSRVRALAVEAGRTVIFDRDEMIARADQHGIAIVAVDEQGRF